MNHGIGICLRFARFKHMKEISCHLAYPMSLGRQSLDIAASDCVRINFHKLLSMLFGFVHVRFASQVSLG
jgi:hypothetical protein